MITDGDNDIDNHNDDYSDNHDNDNNIDNHDNDNNNDGNRNYDKANDDYGGQTIAVFRQCILKNS